MEKEDYLETIYNLDKERGHVRISDVASILKVQKASVTQMMQRLQDEEYVLYKPYFPLQLTLKGKAAARRVAERHKALGDFFTILGVPELVQEKDIHGIEHFLSPITLKKLKKVTAFLKKHYRPKS